MHRFDVETVVLVAYELPAEENLGVRYVAQALIEAGFKVRLLRLNGPGALAAVGAEILALAPGLVGLSMSDNQAATLQLTLTAYLRARGYEGTVVAGGAFATVTRRELLEKHEGLSAIVRREGERPMVLLAQAVRGGASLESIPGVTTRQGEGSAYVERCVTPVSRPYRDSLPRILGVPTARVMASRGCSGSCAYCGSAAVRHDAVVEARRGGYSLEQIREEGVSAQRHRSVSDFADEISELHHEHGVRFFRLVDDHILGPDESRALAWLQELSSALKARGVRQIAWAMMVEPSVVTDAVADALVELGVVQVLVGVEALTEDGLRAIGRRASLLESNRATVQRLHDRGIVTFYNSIFLHPNSTPETLRAELDALPFVPGVAFDVLPLLVFPGTGLYSRLEREGSLLGGMLGCDYAIADGKVSLFRSLLHGLGRKLPRLAASSIEAFEVATLDRLSHALGQGGLSARKRQVLHRVIDDLGALRKELLGTLLEYANQEFGRGDAVAWLQELVLTARPRLQALLAELEAIRSLLDERNLSPKEASRRFALSALTVGALAIATGCGGDLDDTTTTSQAGHSSSGGGGAGGASVGATGGATAERTVPDLGGSTGQGGSPSTVPPYLATNCSGATHDAIRLRIEELVAEQTCGLMLGCEDRVVLKVDAAGAVIDVSTTNTADQFPSWDEVRSCLIKTLSQERYPCLTDGFSWSNQCVILLV